MHFQDICLQKGFALELKQVLKVKSYAPQIYHFVADVFVKKAEK